MQEHSRRRFIESCLAVAGSVCAGCGEGERAAPPSDPPGGDRKGPVPGARAAEVDGAFEPGYVKLHKNGELKKRGEALWKRMKPCKLCPRTCGVDRHGGKKGFCDSGSDLVISSYHPHFGEERPLVGRGGSGTIFFSHCGLRCVFCINYEISLQGQGTRRSIEDIARMMLALQGKGCHNINVVTPTHYSAHIVRALDIAAARGLRLPLVYNTCGWESMEILKKLDGIVDIYLPDMKYASGEMAAKYSTCAPPDFERTRPEVAETYSSSETYPELTKMALLEMHRQVGVAKPASDGLMYRGLMIRHLVMPNRVSGAREVIQWIAKNLPKDTYLNLMSQYTPTHKAFDYPEISRKITREEYDEAARAAKEAGLTNLDIQGYRPG
ncbi:MAG: radical SAM protein [Candidatus Brocadiae bacterium]|nr:radical SAM protein [Candidatus Brocadiia bacterium]